MLEVTKSYKTSDGKLFEDKVSALHHDFKLGLRGILNGEIVTRSDNFTSMQMAELLARDPNKLLSLTQKYKEAIRRATPKTVSVE